MTAEVVWRIQPGAPLRNEFVRLATEEARRAQAELSSPDVPRSQAIHQARRSFKKVRALVRLARPCLGADYARENNRWRDLGRQLAASRDAAVLLATFDRISDGVSLPAKHRVVLRARLLPEEEESGAKANGAVQRVVAELENAISVIPHLNWPRGPGGIKRGLRDSQSRLRRRWKAASQPADDHDSHALHDWRKRVKDMSSQLGLFRTVLPGDLKASRRRAKQVAELLGEEHDLCLLRASISGSGLRPAVANSAARLVAAIDAKRSDLRQEALALGEGFSTRRPKELADGIVENWPAAEAPKRASRGRPERASAPVREQ